MAELLKYIELIQWPVAALAALCLINFWYVAKSHSKNHKLQLQLEHQSKTITTLREDVKILYESASSLGNKLKQLEYSTNVLKEQQEQLSLKEPNQQAYRNAIQSINNGEPVNKIAETSGLSRGEVELLQLFQRVNSEASGANKKKSVVE